MSSAQKQITTLLDAVSRGDAEAKEQLWRIVSDEVHDYAKILLAREGRRGELQTTVLVQEAYLRLVGPDGEGLGKIANRRHLFAAFANAMRCFLVDNARKNGRRKRGGGMVRVELADGALAVSADPCLVLALEEALEKLRAFDPLKAEVVEYRFYTGRTVAECAELLGISTRQANEEWRLARAWLHRELSK